MGYAILSRCLGLLLLTAAVLKLVGLGVDPVARTGIFSGPAFQFMVIVFEISLGIWLVSGNLPAMAWLVVLFTFSVFAGVTFYQGMIGQASCGCAGRIVTINPWIAFTIDLAAVAGLVLKRPDLKPLWEERKPIACYGGAVLGGYLLLIGSLLGIAHLQFGSVEIALATLRNERLSVNPTLVDVGEGNPDETREAAVELTNRTAEPIRVIGGTADCSCTVLGDLPVTISPGESQSITIQMRLPKSEGSFIRKARLTIDDQGFKQVGFRLTGRIVKASE